MTALFVTAGQLADAVVAAIGPHGNAMGNSLVGHDVDPNGDSVIALHGHRLGIFRDDDEISPHGISWLLESAGDEPDESGGWDYLTADQAVLAAAGLAAEFGCRGDA